MLVIQAANALYPVRCLLVTEVAANGVGGIRRIHNNASLAENIHGLVDQPLLGRFRVNLEELAHWPPPDAKAGSFLEPPMQLGESGAAWPDVSHSCGEYTCSARAWTPPAISSASIL